MFWTNWVRGINKIFLAVGIIASILGGAAMIDSNGAVGVIVLFGGILVSISSVSVLMMISEISVSLYEINNKISSKKYDTNSSDEKGNLNNYASQATWVCKNCGTVNPSTSAKCSFCEKSVNNNSNSDTWICPECDTVNPRSSRFCKNCGYQK